MAETEEDAAEAAERLQAALERIAALARPAGAPAGGEPVTEELAARLDAIIARLRAALGGAAEPETKKPR